MFCTRIDVLEIFAEAQRLAQEPRLVLSRTHQGLGFNPSRGRPRSTKVALRRKLGRPREYENNAARLEAAEERRAERKRAGAEPMIGDLHPRRACRGRPATPRPRGYDFGAWTVVRAAGKRHGALLYECRCRCGALRELIEGAAKASKHGCRQCWKERNRCR